MREVNASEKDSERVAAEPNLRSVTLFEYNRLKLCRQSSMPSGLGSFTEQLTFVSHGEAHPVVAIRLGFDDSPFTREAVAGSELL